MTIQLLNIALPLFAYLIGAVPFGLLIVRLVSHRDIREMGSGNIGATNVRRCSGTVWGIATLFCDILKGMVPTWVALHWVPAAPPWLAPVVILAAIMGHMFPVYLKFKPSGKGVATALGCFAVSAPIACGMALLAFIVVVVIKRIVSVGSMTAMILLPLFVWLTTSDLYLTGTGVCVALLITGRHKSNLGRLIKGDEPTLYR